MASFRSNNNFSKTDRKTVPPWMPVYKKINDFKLVNRVTFVKSISAFSKNSKKPIRGALKHT